MAGLYKLERIANPNLAWWLTRPLAILGPLLCTLPVIWLFARKWVRSPAAPVAVAIPAQMAPGDTVDAAPERVGRLT